jgi:3-hydroxyisobutyrate dehydrogenase-like beta-hydroxyacid dehydrogenase
MTDAAKTPVVAIVAAGTMGCAIGARLARNGVAIRTSVRGRSKATNDRATADGFALFDDDDALVAGVDFLLAVLPSGRALEFAERMRSPLGRLAKKPVYVECNPLSMAVVDGIGAIVRSAGCAYVDAGIIGDPPSRTNDQGPRIYVSGDDAARCLVLRGGGLDIRVLDMPAGAASAVKLSYSGIVKGLQAIASAVFACADAAGVGDVFRADFAAGQPQLTAVLDRFLPNMPAKAARWVEEMNELAEFIDAEPGAGPIYAAIARYYEALARKPNEPSRQPAE